jgi:hypothetical protein
MAFNLSDALATVMREFISTEFLALEP